MPFCNFIQMTLAVIATPPFHCIAARTSTLNNWSLCTGMNCDWLIAKENSEQDKKWLCNKTFHWIFQFVSQKMHKRQSRTFTKWLKMVFGNMKENLSLWPSLTSPTELHLLFLRGSITVTCHLRGLRPVWPLKIIHFEGEGPLSSHR